MLIHRYFPQLCPFLAAKYFGHLQKLPAQKVASASEQVSFRGKEVRQAFHLSRPSIGL